MTSGVTGSVIDSKVEGRGPEKESVRGKGKSKRSTGLSVGGGSSSNMNAA